MTKEQLEFVFVTAIFTITAAALLAVSSYRFGTDKADAGGTEIGHVTCMNGVQFYAFPVQGGFSFTPRLDRQGQIILCTEEDKDGNP